MNYQLNFYKMKKPGGYIFSKLRSSLQHQRHDVSNNYLLLFADFNFSIISATFLCRKLVLKWADLISRCLILLLKLALNLLRVGHTVRKQLPAFCTSLHRKLNKPPTGSDTQLVKVCDQGWSVHLWTQDYKFPCPAVAICKTLINWLVNGLTNHRHNLKTIFCSILSWC